jgi:hypothetical protein
MAIALLIGVNQLTMMEKTKKDKELKIPKLKDLFRKKKKEDFAEEEKEIDENKKEERRRVFIPTYNDEEYQEQEDEENEEVPQENLKKNEISEICPDGFKEEKINLNVEEIEENLSVFHDTFGYGKILKYSPEKNRIFIKFEDGTKELSPDYANLKLIKFVEDKQEEKIESVPYLVFEETDPEIQDIHKPRIKEREEEKELEEEIHSQKKTRLIQKLWKGKKII